MGIRWIWFTVLTCVFECPAVTAAPADDGVLHLLSERCAGCHQGSEPAGGLNLDEVRDAQWTWALAALVLSGCSYVGATLSMMGSVPQRLPLGTTFLAQLA